MTQYNIAKAVENYSFFVQCKVDVLIAENLELSKENKIIRNEAENTSSRKDKEKEEALVNQKDYFSMKHDEILKSYAEKLKLKYDQSFQASLKHFQLENSQLKKQITKLSQDLKDTKQALLRSASRKPVYSPGKYTENG